MTWEELAQDHFGADPVRLGLVHLVDSGQSSHGHEDERHRMGFRMTIAQRTPHTFNTRQSHAWAHWTEYSAELKLPLFHSLWVSWCRYFRQRNTAPGATALFHGCVAVSRAMGRGGMHVVSVGDKPTVIDLHSLDTFLHVIPGHAHGTFSESRVATAVAQRGIFFDVGANNGIWSWQLPIWTRVRFMRLNRALGSVTCFAEPFSCGASTTLS
jgi:hypothetical protein